MVNEGQCGPSQIDNPLITMEVLFQVLPPDDLLEGHVI